MSEESISSVNWRGVAADPSEGYKFWSRDLDRHFLGEYSYAVIKGNSIIEDYSEVVVGSDSTFIGVYDGHGGHQTAEFLSNNMYKNLLRCVEQDLCLSPDVLKDAFIRTEDDWVAELKKKKLGEESLAASTSGSSCLVGVIWSGYLFAVANVGDSRAIMGWQEDGSKLVFQPLTKDDNVRDPEVRAEVKALHPEPDFIVEDEQGVYRIKGRSEFSKSIGDAYLKYPDFNIIEGFGLSEPAVLSEPSPIEVEALDPFNGEKFIIFASRGFWKLVENEEAAKIVIESPRRGIAATLVKEALFQAAKNIGRSYEDILNMKDNKCSKLHDDITVVVIFLDKNLNVTSIPEQMTLKIGGSNSSALEKV